VQHRVAITGLGVMAPLGPDVATLLSNLAAGRSAIATLGIPGAERLRSRLAAVVSCELPALEPAHLPMMDRVTCLALAASAQAIEESGLDFALEDPERCGVSVGTSLGGAATTDAGYEVAYGQRSQRIRPFSVLAAMSNAPAAWIGMRHGLTGPALTYSTACSSSAVALGEAARRIQSGEVDIMIAGGSEAPLSLGVMLAWDAMRVLATADPVDPARSCRPFSANRSGLVLGEGAAFCVLEQWEHARQRGARIHAELAGYGLTTDVTHITRPSVAGQARAMRAAMLSARLAAGELDYVNAHGTATLQNDSVETAALKEVLGTDAHRVPVSSTKSMHGHLLGAAGALEFLIAVAAMERRIIPPTMHLDRPDPAGDLDYVAGAARTGMTLRAVMSNSFAFGGTNVALIARAAAKQDSA